MGLITISYPQNAVENGSISVTKSSNELNKASRIGRNNGKLTQKYRPSQRASKRYGRRLRRWFLPIDLVGKGFVSVLRPYASSTVAEKMLSVISEACNDFRTNVQVAFVFLCITSSCIRKS
jgi:hypothetical protein